MRKESLPGDARTDTMHYGGPSFTPEDEEAVAAVLTNHIGPDRAAATPDLIAESGINGSPFRAVLSRHDGARWLLGKNGRGLFVARSAEEAEGFTRQLERHVTATAERIARRRAYASGEEK